MFSPRANVIYASNPIIDTIRGEQQPVRVFAFPVRDTPEPDAILTGDALMTHRIRSVLQEIARGLMSEAVGMFRRRRRDRHGDR